ncbi:hypothetical protein NQ317_010548 [Molorchus minor]|uniref:L-xylulose reductase n=1 Tax=Molorchus minor TaxID=1323400 RepID=A0ABQ9JCC8_9CUCU|nr:hypothetical protein NQ317_010548 [Molorchus minor]
MYVCMLPIPSPLGRSLITKHCTSIAVSYRLFTINIKALMHVTKIVVKNLLTRNAPGSIVNISSQASLVGLNHHTVYCATKGAVDAFTRATALEYGPNNIRVNAVNPTVIMTDMGRLGWSDPNVAKPMLQKIPLKKSHKRERPTL